MFYHHDLRAGELSDKAICLTFDDGPGETAGDGSGPRTSEIGRYLYDHGIVATFFVMGQHAEQYPETLRRLRDWGHLIGNHTWSHLGLVSLAQAGGDVVGELARTDALIRPYVKDPLTFFRPPYGNWRSEGQQQSIVADILNASGRLEHYVGPIGWDISFGEWDWWRRGDSAEACAVGFLQKIAERRRGIVLLHDSSEEAEVRTRNQTATLVKHMVPALIDQGYRFVRLDEIPQIKMCACA